MGLSRYGDSVMDISSDLTFTQNEANIVIKDYVCAICHADLVIKEIPNELRVFIMCPIHNNVCLAGRIMRSTVSIQHEISFRDYYSTIATMPDLFGNIWINGIPYEHAQIISKKSVCALCGSKLIMQGIFLQETKRIDPDFVSLACQAGHGNVGLNGFGFIPTGEYVSIPPIKSREIIRNRKNLQKYNSPSFSKNPPTCTLEKLGVVTLGTHAESENGERPDKFNIILFENRKYPGLETKIKQVYGENVKRINIRIPFPINTMILRESLECYNRGAMIAKARFINTDWIWEYFRDPYDQEIEIRGGQALTLAGLKLQKTPADLTTPIYYTSQGKPVFMRHTGRLHFFIPDLIELNGSPVIGYFEMSISGANVITIKKGVDTIVQQALNKGILLSEIPFVLAIQNDPKNETFIHIETKEA